MKEIEVILVDIGNSSIKITEVIQGEFGETQKLDNLLELANSYDQIPLMISSVTNIDLKVFGSRDVKLLSYNSPMPITLDYETPETLGPDRIAAAVGANELFPKNNNLIVDLGTCMTIDLVDKSAVFRGGIISPGLKMRMTAMAKFTDKLPDISSEFGEINFNVLGKSTKECLYSGSLGGILNEINGVVRTLSKDFTSLNTIITGGDAHFFESKLKAHIFAGSKIVQKGLYRIWKYH
ncbi:type III pantothenate kinase [Ekhidna sp.]|uniref:type III pantothenate kinase n=1 Tax=Ekhidna sp. TaxID=2608089 RepID=UPI003BA888A2